jgi:imidazolonepropionase-like amidohydrolase
MAAGGADSGKFPILRLGFSRDELAAFVEEADKAQTYVCGHLYSDEAVRRAVEIGFQSVEHATLVEPATAKLMKEKNVIVTPTIIAYESQKTEEKALRLDHLVSPRGSTP